ncbi:MAG: hypothetical protein D6815_00175 [Candidatus Dadabacteria bacterium]|nr:MAG: hypothetical protein D6815_00175 [Candidatus Dadabacteria bacterium]
MRTFFLFYLLSVLLRNPLLALVLVALVLYFGEARARGRYFNPSRLWERRSAISELRRTVAINEHDAAAHNDLGRLLLEAGKVEQARPHLEKAIARMPESAETNFYYGLCLLRCGEEEKGLAHIERALEISPRLRYGDPQLEVARYFAQRGRHEETRQWARRAVAINTSNVEAWVLLGEAAAAAGDFDEARRAFLAAREAFAGLPSYLRFPARRWLARAKRGQRRLARA